MSALRPAVERRAGWAAAAALVLLAWAAGLPTAYLLILLHLGAPHVVVPLLLVGWAAVSLSLTVRLRRAARRARAGSRDPGRAAFATLPQRASLLLNGLLLLLGAGGAALVAGGGTGFSIATGPQPGLIAEVVGGFLLLAATVPAAVLNGLWSLDARTAAEEDAVLRGPASPARRTVRSARTIAWITWSASAALALAVLVAAVLGAV